MGIVILFCTQVNNNNNFAFFYNMPLVVVCGIPSSGKTKRAEELAKYLKEKHNRNVVLINQQSLGITKAEGYKGSNQQKITRGRIKFQVQKNLVGNSIVIADSLNYIKGYRYQMYCIAREQKTTYCVLYCNTSIEAAKQFNKLSPNNYPEQLFTQLIKRMEPPQLKNRWDVPLYQRREDESTPLQQIANTLLFQAKKSKDPVSTKQEQKLSEDYLYQVDKLCQQICNEACLGRIKLNHSWNALQTRKIKDEFVGVIREKLIPLKAVKQTFVQFLTEADKRK